MAGELEHAVNRLILYQKQAYKKDINDKLSIVPENPFVDAVNSENIKDDKKE